MLPEVPGNYLRLKKRVESSSCHCRADHWYCSVGCSCLLIFLFTCLNLCAFAACPVFEAVTLWVRSGFLAGLLALVAAAAFGAMALDFTISLNVFGNSGDLGFIGKGIFALIAAAIGAFVFLLLAWTGVATAVDTMRARAPQNK